MSMAEFAFLCKDFALTPHLIRPSRIAEIFRKVNVNDDFSDEHCQELNFDEFLRVLVLVAREAFTKPIVEAYFPNDSLKVHALLDWMFAHNMGVIKRYLKLLSDTRK
jgi:hypothetical protein